MQQEAGTPWPPPWPPPSPPGWPPPSGPRYGIRHEPSIWARPPTTPRLLVLQTFVMLVVLTGNAVVFRVRQIPEALMYSGLFVEVLLQISLFSAPTIFVFMRVARTKVMIVACGACAAGIICWGWWGAAESWHSTSSLGPFFAGFFGGPISILAVLLFGQGGRRLQESLGRRTGS